MACVISRTALATIHAHAASRPAMEVCGLLFGNGGIAGARPVANVSDRPATRFELDPVALFAALRAERAGGAKMVGHYHSHPTGIARPSATDAALAEPDGRLWLIVAGDAVSAWRAVIDGACHGRFDHVTLQVSPVAT